MTHARRRLRIGTAAVLVAAVVTAVAVAASEDSSPRSPILPSAAGLPGTPLGDGYEVVEGTTLIGDAIPAGISHYAGDEPVIDEGWTANTLVGDGVILVDALRDYLGQAEQNGLVVERQARCADASGIEVCTGFARSEEDLTTLTVYGIQGAHAGVLSGHVVVSLSTLEGLWHTGGPMVEVPPPFGEPPDPAPWTPLASEGDELPTTYPVPRAVVVEEGSRLAGPVRHHGPEFGRGIYAVLEVTDDPDVVLGRYVDQLTRAGLQQGQDAVTEDAGDATLTKVGFSEAGGDQFQMTFVERPGRPTWLIIESGYD